MAALEAFAQPAKESKMLTDDEVNEIFRGFIQGEGFNYVRYARAIEAAHIAKQSEPDIVPFDYTEWRKGGWIPITDRGVKHHSALFLGVNYTTMEREL